MNREQELEFLKGQADMLRDELKELEKEIGELPGEQK
jgi:prefoldin subunit 5